LAVAVLLAQMTPELAQTVVIRYFQPSHLLVVVTAEATPLIMLVLVALVEGVVEPSLHPVLHSPVLLVILHL
jgi:hypothetical protein